MKKIILITCGAIACTLFALLILGGRDIPPPDVSDLELTFPDVPPDENAFTYYDEAFSQAQIVDDLCFVKSMHTEQVNHAPAISFMLSGSEMPGRPHLPSR